MTEKPPTRLSVTMVVGFQQARAMAVSFGGPLALAVAIAAAAWMILLDLRQLQSSGLVVRSHALGTPLAAALLIALLFLGTFATASVARDRESGTLEVLFYGPIDELSYGLGKLLGLILAYATALPLITACFALFAWVTGFAFDAELPAGAVLSLAPAAEVAAFAVLVSVSVDRVRSAVLLFIAAAAFLIGTGVAYQFILLVPIDDAASPLIPIRDALATLDSMIGWLSPFARLQRMLADLGSGTWPSVGAAVLLSAAFAAVMIALAAWILRRRNLCWRGG